MNPPRSVQSPPLPVAPTLQVDAPQYRSLEALYEALRAQDPQQSGFGPHVVPGRGSPLASLMLIGEQPGDQEDLAEQTFVGPAGKLLDRCLTEAGIAPDKVFMTNAVKRFKFQLRGKRRIHQTPNAGDIAHYRWWLGQEIRLIDPALVMPLGTTALLALLGVRQTLKSLRGKMLPWNGRQLLATVHPSYLLRIRASDSFETEEQLFVEDLKRAGDAVRKEGVRSKTSAR